MDQPGEYIGILVTFIIAFGIVCLMIFLNKILGPKGHRSETKATPFECGVEPSLLPKAQFSIKFYLIAMLFILFDVEIVWFFPWAVILRELGWVGIAEMFTFVAVLALGFVYAWKKGALEWEK